MRFLVLGAAGMAGHVVARHLQEAGHEVDTVARSTRHVVPTFQLDVRDTRQLDGIVAHDGYDVVVNCVGLLIQACDDDPADAAFVNGYLPQHLARSLASSSTRLVHLSTDCVFSGRRGPYAEDAPYDGQRMYDRSKALGEVVNDKDLTLRMSIIGPELTEAGTGLFGWFARQRGTVQGYTRARWNGVTTIELARAVEALAGTDTTGLVHLVPGESVSKCELLEEMNRVFGHGLTIEAVPGHEVDKRLARTRRDVSFEVRDYDTMLSEMRDWIVRQPSSYPHYRHLLGSGSGPVAPGTA